MRLHAIVEDLETARIAVEGGATVVQLRLKDLPTLEVVERGRAFRGMTERLGITFIVNDDVEAALQLGADGVHLGRDDRGAERALDARIVLGLSASDVGEAIVAQRTGASYIGAGPVWATPTKPDAAQPIGLDGIAAIADAVSVPVIAIGGVDASNAGPCIKAGASGVAVIRAARDARAIREAIDAAL